jgi:predicted PurR-regulated permease PerM
MKFSELENSTQIILKVVLVVLVLAFLWTVREIIALFLLAVVFASAMDPLADYLNKKKIPRAVSVMAVYVLVLGLVVLVVSQLAPVVAEQFRVLSDNLPTFLLEFQNKYPLLHGVFGEFNSGNFLQGLFGKGDGAVFSGTLGVFSGLFGFVTVMVVSFYLVVADENGMKELIRPLVPITRQGQVMQIISKIQKKMGLWVLGQLILSLSIFALTFIALMILGVKYALVLALLAGLFEVVPYIGPILSAIPAFFFALIQSPALAVGVVVLYILIQKIEGYVLVPKVMQKAVGASPLVILLSLLIGFKLAGIVGLLLAVPVASALLVVIEELRGEGVKN